MSGRKPKKSEVVDYGLTTDKYSWNQEMDEVTIVIPFKDFEGTLRARDVDCTIEPFHLKVGLKGEEPIIDVRVW
eukprot:CAMPEP_0177677886 /NCGR_PEP_ID=MMETSP0447-20121125/28681_1 /TAXON_ID=0 /ORGANISM="Stygamoeba regulata, Strain BSH-02190019" /LENGTH=73 /DNA_ID=CAMNT_0019186785 /DNA_START=1 /DNA_END=219 /DNA_ORIENTATION=+